MCHPVCFFSPLLYAQSNCIQKHEWNPNQVFGPRRSYIDIPLFMPSILILLHTYTTVLNASVHYIFVILLSFSMHRTTSHNVRLRRSAIPFCSWLYSTVNSRDIFSLSHRSDICIFVFTAVVTTQAFNRNICLHWIFWQKSSNFNTIQICFG